jgi:predicted small lipoprotein YifL
MRTPMLTTAFALALLTLTGCGQTGPLQLPPREAPAAAQPPPAGDTQAAPASNG